ncbi:MAG: ATP-dependent DNA helicase RecG [Candidatus Omnitrophica bacterium]|nr:ATP-dependent DNA helicase RecG [Candidatus Omnitrophota bacterium]
MNRQAPLSRLPHQTPVQYIKGVGPARADRLKRLGVETAEDLLWLAPRRYEDRSRFAAIREAQPGSKVTIQGRVLSSELRRLPNGRTLLEAVVGDDTGVLRCLWFNQPYLARQIREGEQLIVYGEVEGRTSRQMVHPEVEHVEREPAPDDPAHLHVGRIVPIYPLTEGIGQRWLRRVANTALECAAGGVPELLPEELRRRLELARADWALSQLHFPDSWETLERARARLSFDELFLMQVRLALRRARFAQRTKPQRYQLEGELAASFRRQLPFALTASQEQVLREILDDVSRPTPMLRLLQGDVGCGKTVVAAMAMLVAIQSGFQAALMAPTELLAAQHARVLRAALEPLGVSVGLLAAGTEEDRPELLRRIADGSTALVVGTHALLEPSVTFARLAFVVIDEQHKFGVTQRAALVRKAVAPDVLVMTATPIPRTLALSLYGDLTCSTITELPLGRRPVRTVRLPEAKRDEAYTLIRAALQEGRQGYIVYPLVEAKAGSGLKAAAQMVRQLQHDVFPGVAVELIHGQMPSAAQERVMRNFSQGSTRLLVSTVVIEVGLDVPNATVMLIEHAERFGLSQLHQLRGRISRGSHPATCLVLSEASDELSRQRLSAFVDTTDGFQLAERDLVLRGPGELLGRDQHGWWRFRVADLARDAGVLEQARREAFALVARDPVLRDPALAALRAKLGMKPA